MMTSTERFAAIREEMMMKRATMTAQEYQADCESHDQMFEAHKGNQAYADTSVRQMQAIATLGLRVQELEAQEKHEAVNDDDIFMLRTMVFGQ